MTDGMREPGRDGREATEHRLPLTEPALHHVGTVSEALIRTVVTAFYDVVRRDEFVGPIFAERITDWPRHLARMCDFWSTIVLRSGRYGGRPLEVHARIPHLRGEHFSRWLELWIATIEQHAPPQVRSRFTVPAVRMARTMAQRGDHQAIARRSAVL